MKELSLLLMLWIFSRVSVEIYIEQEKYYFGHCWWLAIFHLRMHQKMYWMCLDAEDVEGSYFVFMRMHFRICEKASGSIKLCNQAEADVRPMHLCTMKPEPRVDDNDIAWIKCGLHSWMAGGGTFWRRAQVPSLHAANLSLPTCQTKVVNVNVGCLFPRGANENPRSLWGSGVWMKKWRWLKKVQYFCSNGLMTDTPPNIPRLALYMQPFLWQSKQWSKVVHSQSWVWIVPTLPLNAIHFSGPHVVLILQPVVIQDLHCSPIKRDIANNQGSLAVRIPFLKQFNWKVIDVVLVDRWNQPGYRRRRSQQGGDRNQRHFRSCLGSQQYTLVIYSVCVYLSGLSTIHLGSLHVYLSEVSMIHLGNWQCVYICLGSQQYTFLEDSTDSLATFPPHLESKTPSSQSLI